MEVISGFGLSSKYDYYEFNLDSLDFSSPQSAAATALNWPTFEVGGTQPLTNVVALKIIQAEIPFSYYVFVVKNGTFLLEETGGAGGGQVNVTITPQNYTIDQMLVELKTRLDAASPNANTYTVTYNEQTQKITIVSDLFNGTGFELTFGAITNSGNTNPRLYIGFPGGTTASSGATLVSPNVVLLSGPNYLYLNSVRYGQLTNNLLPKGAENLGGGNHGPQICKIPVNAAPGEIITYDDPNPNFWFNIGNSPTFQALDFYFTLGNTTTQFPVDFNGLSFSLKLGILTLKTTEAQSFGGGFENGRVSKRSRPL